MQRQYVLVYQGGIANVILCPKGLYDPEGRSRVLQADFRTCENFCRGLMEAGQLVAPAWCNKAGDIISEAWNYGCFSDAPFYEKFALVAKC